VAARLSHVFLIAALALTACATSREPSAELSADAPANRIVVAPLNLAIRAPAENGAEGEPVWRELLRYFQALDRQVAVLRPSSAEWLWREATLDLDVSDRDRAWRTACSRFAQALAEHWDYDLLVLPSLVLRPAQLRGRYAVWDGVERVVPNGADVIPLDLSDFVHPVGSVTVLGLRGKIAAVSLHASVLRPDGRHVFEGLGGLDVIQEFHRDDPWEGRWTFGARAEPFAEPEHLREGIERAFERTLLATARSR
jgi:hypothetical protein